ncbi:hypothetical protein ACTXT7_015785 [Hymenolepis weldensis]
MLTIASPLACHVASLVYFHFDSVLKILLKNHYDNHTNTIRETLKGVNLKAICKQCRECLDFSEEGSDTLVICRLLPFLLISLPHLTLSTPWFIQYTVTPTGYTDYLKTKGKYPLSCVLCPIRPTSIREGALTIAELKEMKIAKYSDESNSTIQSLLQAFFTCTSFIIANYTDWLNEVKKLVEENASQMKDFFGRQPDEFFYKLSEELKSVVFNDESAKTSDAKSSSSNPVSALMLLVEGIALSFTIAIPSELEIMRKFARQSCLGVGVRRDDGHPFRCLCANTQTHSGTACGHYSGDHITTGQLVYEIVDKHLISNKGDESWGLNSERKIPTR